MRKVDNKSARSHTQIQRAKKGTEAMHYFKKALLYIRERKYLRAVD